MHVTTNSNKSMVTQYFECRSTRMATMEQQTIYRKYPLQDSQYGVQPRGRSYEVHKHIVVNIDVIFTNMLIQNPM